MDHGVPSSGPKGLRSSLQSFGHWMAEAVRHAFGNPHEKALHQPPAVGVQPFSERPARRRLRHS